MQVSNLLFFTEDGDELTLMSKLDHLPMVDEEVEVNLDDGTKFTFIIISATIVPSISNSDMVDMRYVVKLKE